ncbi:MAG: glucan biosynthesis protein [Roseimicrobium sp.]
MPHRLIAGLFALALLAPSQAQVALPPIRTFLDLEAYASKLAQQPYATQQQALDPFFDQLEYDEHRQIRFRADKALYGDVAHTYRIEFFHPGWTAKKTVEFFEINDGQPTQVPFSKGLFDYGPLQVPETAKNPGGYAGFRLIAPDTLLDKRFEFLVFMGASYFRAVTTKLGWGLSARALAINTVGGEPEEFPDFTHFWFVKPKAGEKVFQFYALLNGKSVAGAYRFEVSPGEVTLMRVSGSLYLRNPVKLLGLAPFSSMFWFGENTHPKGLDFRPEVHDSDGLLIEQMDGRTIWRPLDNGREMRQSIFSLEGIKGFGLQKRDREFGHFQDLEAHYHQRVSVWVEPLEGFGRGKLHLIELATGEETWDNIVTMWEPETQPTATEPLRFAYNLNWLKEKEHDLAKVTATRWGEAVATPKIPNDYLFVLDFTKGKSMDKPADWLPGVELNLVGNATVLDKRVMANPETGGWRAFFKLDIPAETQILEMTCDLMDEKQPISERWAYQWRR